MAMQNEYALQHLSYEVQQTIRRTEVVNHIMGLENAMNKLRNEVVWESKNHSLGWKWKY